MTQDARLQLVADWFERQGWTPFAFPLLVDRLRQTVSSETLEDRIRRMVEAYERVASL